MFVCMYVRHIAGPKAAVLTFRRCTDELRFCVPTCCIHPYIQPSDHASSLFADTMGWLSLESNQWDK